MKFSKGDCVLTSYGVGVVTNIIPATTTTTTATEDDVLFYKVLLWRIPGKSMASCASAWLRPSHLVEHLPAAPGMVTFIKTKKGGDSSSANAKDDNDVEEQRKELLILGYSNGLKTYTVIPWDLVKDSLATIQTNGTVVTKQISTSNNPNVFTLSKTEVEAAPSCKFYPLLEDLLRRGDKAAKQAVSLVSTHSEVLYDKSNELISKSAEMVKSSGIAGGGDVGGVSSDKTKQLVQDLSKEATSVIKSVNETQAKEIIQMLKDEELATLLEKGRDRLRQLMTDDIPQATTNAMNQMGITFAPSGSGASTSLSIKTKKLNDTNSVSSNDDDQSSTANEIILSRAKALEAMDELLETHANMTMEQFRTQAETQFNEMFDSFAAVAKSDTRLSTIFDTINEHTSEWQEATGRVMASKSASIFMEGAQRLHARAATLFSMEQLHWAQEQSLKLTKDITESDAALARLKSIELGDALRSRLFAAIELRSGSAGGLDGIIADALMQLDTTADQIQGTVAKAAAGDDDASGNGNTSAGVQMMLANLETQASSTAKQAHETLLATLAHRSQYCDLVLGKIEESLTKLQTYLGDEYAMTADEISTLASGEGGTAALFDPIAKRAAKEINKQLDAAEQYVSDDPTMMTVLKSVRRILSGEITLNALADGAVNLLNEDRSVAMGEQLLVHGERVLDVLENASKSKYLNDVIAAMERAGLTKEEMMKQLENLNMNSIVDVAETAVSDEKARTEMISKAADSALDFVLRILPSMPVPPFDGVRDGLIYHLSNLSMEGFKVRKENILVEIAGIRTTNMYVDKNKQSTQKDDEGGIITELKNEQEETEFLEGGEKEEDGPTTTTTTTTSTRPVKATELLVIDIQDIGAVLERAVWKFEQTYFPYLKGEGKAFVQLWEGSIRLQFELRKKRRDKSATTSSDNIAAEILNSMGNDNTTIDDNEWEPVLCLHEHLVSIGKLELKLLGEGKMVWLLNKISSMLKAPLTNFVARSVQKSLRNSSGLLLEKLNETLSPYWSLVMKTAGINMDDLEEVTMTDVISGKLTVNPDEIELVWRERLPLGMNLLMNDESGLIKVVEFPRGSQARNVVDLIGVPSDSFKGATITAVNGVRYGMDDQDELVEALKDPARPKAITFLLTDPDEAERIRQFCGLTDENDYGINNHQSTDDDDQQRDTSTDSAIPQMMKIVKIEKEGPIGIQFSNSPDDFCLTVEGFASASSDDNTSFALDEHNTNIDIGDLLVSINDTIVLGLDGTGRDKALKEFELYGTQRPLQLGFVKSFLWRTILHKDDLLLDDDQDPDPFSTMKSSNESSSFVSGPKEEMILIDKVMNDEDSGKKVVCLDGFKKVAGSVERSKVFIGDQLIYINAEAIGTAAQSLGVPSLALDEIQALLKDSNQYPMSLVFARFSRGRRGGKDGNYSNNLDNATKITVHIEQPDDLGTEFGENSDGMIVVKSLIAVTGPIQRFLVSEYQQQQQTLKQVRQNRLQLVIESIDGQAVPSYANADMVQRAMQQSWDHRGHVEIVFCDMKHKLRLRQFAASSASAEAS